jgi:hypothetical protein
MSLLVLLAKDGNVGWYRTARWNLMITSLCVLKIDLTLVNTEYLTNPHFQFMTGNESFNSEFDLPAALLTKLEHGT